MIEDFKTAFIAALEAAAPELRGKVQAGAVDAETPVPYAAFTTPEETPLHTKHGIAGVQTLSRWRSSTTVWFQPRRLNARRSEPSTE